MIFLDQKRIVQADPVILAAPTKHGVFLASPKAGERFTRIQNGDVRAFYGIRVAARSSSGTHQGLQEVQRGAFACENLAGVASQGAECGICGQPITILHMPLNLHIAQLPEDLISPGNAAHDRVFAGNDGGGRFAVGIDKLSGDVAAADVFFKSKAYVALNIVTHIVGQGDGHAVLGAELNENPQAGLRVVLLGGVFNRAGWKRIPG